MTEQFAEMLAAARNWFEEGRAAGWVEPPEFERFEAVEGATPADLFVDAQTRPLVVAFFGGTGVGKSSLLNRLAGAAVARVGVERPTSREITLYVHRDVALADFPQTLPLESVQVKRHTDAAQREVMWIDAPDIDSIEVQNRSCALAWLPHIDLLVYVVSPERYRDDVGWRVLLERRQRHGWMFVMNRWDEGALAQRDDLARMMRSAGFDDPLVLCTSCQAERGLPSPDEFPRVRAVIGELLAAHGVRELARLGHRARLHELRGALRAAAERLGDDERWDAVHQATSKLWEPVGQMLREGLDWPIRDIAIRLGARERGSASGWSAQALRLLKPDGDSGEPEGAAQPEATELTYLTESLWDGWADAKLSAFLESVEQTARQGGIATRRLRSELDAFAGEARNEVMTRLQDEVRAALARPGTALQRGLRRVTGFLSGVLPFLALTWVGMNLVWKYFRASTGDEAYPSLDFAVSSLLIVLLAWAVPFWLDRLLRPSVERTVLRALRTGVSVSVDELGQALRRLVTDAAEDAGVWRQKVEVVLKQVGGALVRPVRTDRDEIARFVAGTMAENAPQPASGARR